MTRSYNPHPHQRSLTDYRTQPSGFVSPSQEESMSLEETQHRQVVAHEKQIVALLGILLKDTEQGQEFMVEEVFDNYDLGNTDRRVLGSVIRRAKTMCLVEHVGHRKSGVKGHHGELKSVWKRV